ncbi:MAG: DUF2116 family Zn-ribbon domain-containing protein [Candidatus Lokiarchaeota archaeon]
MSKSSWKSKIEKKWGPHKHCPICGKAMPTDNKFCSQECKDNYLSDQKGQNKFFRQLNFNINTENYFVIVKPQR